jgi:enoyl-CoA hydratase
MPEVVLVEKQDGVATVTLNRPEARNALSAELREALAATFSELSGATDVSAIILTGAGKAFCAGLDLRELGAGGLGRALGPDTDLIGAMERCPLPILGAVNGAAITGGFEIALCCDILIGSSDARFADTHARVGILPGWGLSAKLSRLVGIQRAKLAALTGNFIDAAEAERWGLLARVVAPDALLPTCREIARDIASCVPEAVLGYKRLIDDTFAVPYAEARSLERKRSAEHARSVNAADIAARRAGIQARGKQQSGQ